MEQPAFIWQAYSTTASATATDSATGTAAADALLATEDPGVIWKPADITGTKSFTIDMGAAMALDCFALSGAGLSGITVEVRASTDNFSASDVQLLAGTSMIGSISAWRKFTNAAEYQYYRLNFSSFGTDFYLAFVALDQLQLLPWLSDGHDPDQMETDTEDMESPTGIYLGSVQNKIMRNLSLDFGQVLDNELTIFQSWANDCFLAKRGFFYVPDSSASTVYFGRTDKKYKFTAPRKKGLADLGAIPFISRLI